MTTESIARGKHQYLYMRQWPNGVASIDLVRHHDEMPAADHPVAPLARKHTTITDALILKWYDVHGPDSAWPIALHLGGPREGYTADWILQRYCYILDQMHDATHEEATPAPILIVEAEPVEETPEPPVIPATPVTPPPTEAAATRPPTPEKVPEEKPSALLPGFTPQFMRRKWNDETDKRMLDWVDVNGQNWRALARAMGGRRQGYSDDAVRNRYMRIKGIKSTKGRYVRGTPTRGPKWSETEDALITELYDAEKHNRWKMIAGRLGNDRTPAAVRLRAQRLGLFEYRGKFCPD